LFFISENEALVTLTARAGQGDGQSAGGGQQRTVQSPEFGGWTSVWEGICRTRKRNGLLVIQNQYLKASSSLYWLPLLFSAFWQRGKEQKYLLASNPKEILQAMKGVEVPACHWPL